MIKMKEFINKCVIDTVSANIQIKDIINNDCRYYYHYIFIYIHLVKNPPKTIVQHLINAIKTIIDYIDIDALNPKISVYENCKLFIHDTTKRFISDDFNDRLELFHVYPSDKVKIWIKDELEDNKDDERYLYYYMMYCKRLLPLNKVIMNTPNDILMRIFGNSYTLNIYDILREKDIDDVIEQLITDTKANMIETDLSNEENTLFESVYSYHSVIIIEQNNHKYIITPPEFEFTLTSKRNIYTNEELPFNVLMVIYTLYTCLYPYLGTYKENLERYLDSTSEDDMEEY